MIYLIGGAPRAGKSILCQQVSAKLKVGWISTDLIMELLRLKDEEGIKKEWNASLEAITADAEWFFPYLERFIWGISSMAEDYAIEGVDFLPVQIAPLSTKYVIRSVFLGRSSITLDVFDQFPGRSPGYSYLPEEMRRQIVRDVPLWSEFIRREAECFGYPYVDMAGDFPTGLREAEALLTSDN
jgi:hypothetical protein